MALLLTVATGAWAQDPDPIDLTPSADGTVWTLSTMPEYDTELEVTYYTDEEVAEMEKIGYYLVGNMNGWTPDSKYKLTENTANPGEYMITLLLEPTSQFKVVYSEDGTTAKYWYPSDGPNYGEGGQITEDDRYTVYFKPGTGTTDNSAALTEWDGYEADVTLTRTLIAGSWNTLAVPFNVSSQMLYYLTSTYGMSVKQLASTTLENEGKTLMLTFTDATEMVAGTPYLVKVTTDFDFSAQALPDVVISKELHPVTTTYADFIPTLGKTTIDGVDAENILFVAAGNLLKHPAEMPADMKGFRAYFSRQLTMDN